jgi:hypothetical protein
MNDYSHTLPLLLLLLITPACSSDSSVDIGDGSLGQELSDYAASWEGYVEAFTFSDGSDRVRITLNGSGEGTLRVGDAPTPVTDPRPQGRESDNPFTGVDEPFPGFAYSIRFAEVEASRLRFRFDTFEPMADFCSAQSSYQWHGDYYSCLPQDAYSCLPQDAYSCPPDILRDVLQHSNFDECPLEPERERPVPVDCFALGMCREVGLVCDCDAEGCATPETTDQVPFGVDAALADSGDSLEGTLQLGEKGPRPVVRLARQ